MYINRSVEEKLLQDFYEGDQQVACVYGRQGMGKTTLLRHFIEDKKSIYFQAFPTTDQEELDLLSQALGIEPKGTLEEVLNEITLDEIMKESPLVFVIDHYPEFVKADLEYEKILYRYVTEVWKGLPIKVILCGDCYTHMEKFVTGKKAIWHSVELYKMEVKGMPFSEAQAFFPERSQEEMVFLYGITGGIPKKMAAVYGMDAEEAIREIYLDGQYATLMWPMQTMQMELRELSYYNRMLSCLAQGNQRVNQISREVNKPKDVVVPYMNTLMAMGMVTKETPITERTNRKKTRYSIVNTADLFWYRYMPKNMNAVYQEDETAIENLLETMLTDSNDYLKTVFINLCKEYLMNSGNDTLPFQIEEIGNWWMNDEENQVSVGFDIVGLGKSGDRDVTVYAMCYYDDKPIEIHELKALIELTKQLEQEGDVYYIIFSKAGFHENAQTVAVTIKNIMLISLDEILPKA
ncbi:hypothetical protein SAMN02910453_1356 [Lachnospiraceae bacterium A10]|jgi:AAA+ ATPase superfamily predicted ATPase|nr:hypothetical protein SAMN02910453_1356 [Lachnospiraceae bacterium A10]